MEILKSQIVEEILKRQMAAKFTVEKNSIPDFWEFWKGNPNTKAIQSSVWRLAGRNPITIIEILKRQAHSSSDYINELYN